MRLFRWCHRHLFSTPLNALLTILSLIFLTLSLPPLLDWFIFQANWAGQSVSECEKAGACWPFVIQRFEQFMYGFYPEELRYRVNLSGVLLVLAIGTLFIHAFSFLTRFLLLMVLSIGILLLMHGGILGLERVPTSMWGGLSLTVLLSAGAIVSAFPIAILLALGRHSQLPFVKSLCVIFIEFVRGVPLISVLYMASVMLPMFLSPETDLDKLFRAYLGITLFQSAYLAEVIRGGLNAMPKGQYEAAQALGLGYVSMQRLIILPQALTIMIPGIVNSFIALFKDTSLVMIIGLFDFLGIVQAATTDPKWLGTAFEGYIFCAFVYWLFCYAMAAYSQRLELKLGRTR